MTIHWVKAALVGAVLQLPAWAHAEQVQWLLQGTVTASYFPDQSVPFGVGDAFTDLLSFDTAAVFNAGTSDPAGGVYRYRGHSITMNLVVGSFVVPDTIGFINGEFGGGGIIARDNAVDPTMGDRVDGLTFNLRDASFAGEVETFNVIMRGPVLDVVTIGPDRLLPALPDPRLAGLRTSIFQFCRSTAANEGSCNLAQLDIQLNRVSAVPEPAALALMGGGLFALLAWRRRRPT